MGLLIGNTRHRELEDIVMYFYSLLILKKKIIEIIITLYLECMCLYTFRTNLEQTCRMRKDVMPNMMCHSRFSALNPNVAAEAKLLACALKAGTAEA